MATQYFIHQQNFTDRIQQGLENIKGYDVELGTTQLRLSQGWLPTFGMSLSRLDLFDQSCSSRRLSTQNLFVHVRFFDLLMGELKPDVLDIEWFELSLPKNCDRSETLGPPEPSGVAKPSQQKSP
ncbi:MAG: hypothetical protein AAF203_04060, partial [Pseudomonadota bacterium]